MGSEFNDEERIRARRRRLIEEGRRRKRRQQVIRRMIRMFGPPVLGILFVALLITAGRQIFLKPAGDAGKKTEVRSEAETAGGQGALAGDLEEGLSGGASDGGQIGGSGLSDGGQIGGSGLSDGGQIGGSGLADGGQIGGSGYSDAGQNGGAGYSFGAQSGGNAGGGGQGAQDHAVYSAKSTSSTRQLGDDIVSSHAILVDLDTDTILAQKEGMSRMVPASMTKVLTILVAAEHVTDLDDTFTITLDITDYSFVNGCSNVGFLDGETVTVRDLFYGTILPSGADAAVGLAVYTAGSREAFVDMMNDKLEELGLSDTAHFTNCVGIYDEDHYCSAYDMAMIMEAAVNNELCREVLSAHTYVTSPTEQHPEGIPLSNWFLRRIEDKDTGGEVVYGKTGYVPQSGNCSVSYAQDAGGKRYICVTAGAGSVWNCINDHTALFKRFATGSA